MNHIMIDGYRADESHLDNMTTVNFVLNEIVDKLNLESQMPPFLLPYYYAKERSDDGISAFVILSGGHITIHTFPHRGCLFVDLLYDGYFDEDKLSSILRKRFAYHKDTERRIRTERRFYDTTINSEYILNNRTLEHDFGPHLITKIENVDVSFEQIFDMLDILPEKVNMTPICRPYVLKTPEYISGIVLIAQSHIAFHYSIKEKTLFCDLFSCTEYKSTSFVDFLHQEFKDVEIEDMTLIRGSKHDKQILDREQQRINTLKVWKKWRNK